MLVTQDGCADGNTWAAALRRGAGAADTIKGVPTESWGFRDDIIPREYA